MPPPRFNLGAAVGCIEALERGEVVRFPLYDGGVNVLREQTHYFDLICFQELRERVKFIALERDEVLQKVYYVCSLIDVREKEQLTLREKVQSFIDDIWISLSNLMRIMN